MDFLQGPGKLAALLPTAARLARLQQDCLAMLPAAFEHCAALHLDDGELLVAVPNAALATRMKQGLSKLQAGLAARGWPVRTIKLKIQVLPAPEPAPKREPHELPGSAVAGFEALEKSLPDTAHNTALKEALAALVSKRKR